MVICVEAKSYRYTFRLRILIYPKNSDSSVVTVNLNLSIVNFLHGLQFYIVTPTTWLTFAAAIIFNSLIIDESFEISLVL